MINVLIVEDELAALERITSFSFWSGSRYRIAGTARDGAEALEMQQTINADVIITDIEMPVMNGIEMIRELRMVEPDLPVIILSCHESFEYAREAVFLGVREYILKDFMEESAVRLALTKMSASTEDGRNKDYTASEKLRRPAEGKALLAAVNRTGGDAEDSLARFKGKSNALIFVHIDCFSIAAHDPERFLDEINHDLFIQESKGGQGLAVYADSGNFWVLIKDDPVLFAERFFDRMKNRNDTMTLAVGECFDGLRNLKTEAATIEILFSFRVFLGKNRIILPETIKSISGKNPSYIKDKIEMVKNAVYESDSASCFSILRELYERDLPGMLKYNYLEYVNLRLLSIILALAERGKIDLRELTGKDYLSIKELEEKETVTEMREWFESLFSKIFNIEENDISSMVTNRNIMKVINIIKTRYDEDLKLEDIAEEIGVHKVYLSRLFKKETGRNYYDFLQSYRIRKAELLLGEENLKMYEVAKKAGFNNYDQFAVVFKKVNGTAPTEYKKKLTD